MTEVEILTAIMKRVNGSKDVDLSLWTIGVTDDPERRYQEHGKPKHWLCWEADTEEQARAVESFLIEKGMKGGTGGPGSAGYVYIF